MICDDCLFERGIDEYEFHRPHRYVHYTCTICGEFISTNRGYNHNKNMDRLIEKYIGDGKNEKLKY